MVPDTIQQAVAVLLAEGALLWMGIAVVIDPAWIEPWRARNRNALRCDGFFEALCIRVLDQGFDLLPSHA